MTLSRFRLMPVAELHSRQFIFTQSGRKAGKGCALRHFRGPDRSGGVRALFGRPAIQTRVRGYEVWYYEIRVYNPFEEFPDIRGR